MKLLLVAIIAYFLGNISFAILIGKIFFKKDVRNYGSGNAGTTNAIRAFGFKIGILTFIGDFLKGVAAVLIGKSIVGIDGMYVGIILVIIGHNWPILLKFKGGKGVATTIGAMCILMPWTTLICFVIGISLVLVTRIVSIGSLTGVGLVSIVYLFQCVFNFLEFDVKFFIVVCLISCMCFYQHRENIKRLIKKEEKRL